MNIFYEHTLDFELLTAVTMKNDILWEVKPCGLVEDYRRFGGTYASTLRVDE
jgi:hypothetical protein